MSANDDLEARRQKLVDARRECDAKRTEVLLRLHDAQERRAAANDLRDLEREFEVWDKRVEEKNRDLRQIETELEMTVTEDLTKP